MTTPPADPDRRRPTPLAGRTVLVTGGAVRVGEAISRELAARGARVIVHYRSSADEAERLAAELGHGALAAGADLAAA
ncbi:MAG TPA: SDR family NAD(P)-dependent oxidoreductase, partial [Thermoanaerobaculia bacterium]|nr:SDR family NAD(P)-dependent oxidoreductase [Thermoanaerobaculia bacterium]